MVNERGNLSIDFLVGFTIFMLAFIWIASMIPGILLGLQSSTIDFDAVAYRTGVILAEDPGWPSSPPWEFYGDNQKYEISRFGLATAKDTPGILSQDKVNRFFCSSFIYPDDYHTRAIFGDYPYRFNISVIDVDRGIGQSVGDILPDRYGYIRRLVKIKGTSNTSIGSAYFLAHKYNNTAVPSDFNVTRHEFSILINNTKLRQDQRDPVYQIDPTRDQIIINITDLQSTIFPAPPTSASAVKINLKSIKVYKQEGSTLSLARTFDTPYIDGSSTPAAPPVIVNDNISLIINPRIFDIMQTGYSNVYLNLTFDMQDSIAQPVKSSFLNNSLTAPFDYNYNPANVTQPKLRDAVVEVAVW
ncbi:MAG: hypothetical protein LUQ71_06075 [Methanoregula sp.]|jgi:hypothetical protein|nr:hypothetical protein [Methanoregula sp.]